MRLILFLIILVPTINAQTDLWRQVEIIRSAHGVPHIRAQNLRAAGYALAWLQCEDYGRATPMRLLEASGRAATVEGSSKVESDFSVLRHRARAMNYNLLSKDVREMYEGFAAGVNRYIELHRTEFPNGMPSDFTARDVAAMEIVPMSGTTVRNFVNKMTGQSMQDSPLRRRGGEKLVRTKFASDMTSVGLDGERRAASRALLGLTADTLRGYSFLPLDVSAVEVPKETNDGSNTWAFGPSRTKSGKAILMRNPHLRWTAGYYEAHMTVPGVVDFYGDFRIGGPFTVIGGFNKYLGWSTTNNSQDLDEIYELDADPQKPNHYLFDGASRPLINDSITVKIKSGETMTSETREFFSTSLGPVIHRANDKIYIIKYAGYGDMRNGDQMLRMMRSRTLKEWKDAMRMRARVTSNFTYADRKGNIFFIWNATLPLLPHAPVADTVAIPAKKTSDVWMKYVPFESLPQLHNPKGGYIHNENSSPHYTNIRGPINTVNAYPNFEPPELSLRSQLSIQLINGNEKFSLEDVWQLKHNYRMLTADRVKNELIAAVRSTNPTGDIATGITLLESWDNTASHNSRGSALFEEWWATYSGLRRPERRLLPDEERFAKVWSVSDPFNTPSGLADPTRAVESFATAVGEVKRLYGAIDVTWGGAHRVRRGNVDVPVGGCSHDLGCFRTLSFNRAEDGQLVAIAGDAWVLAVEFGDVPRAISVLAYGESNRESSPWHADQAEMFAKGEMKRVAFTRADVDQQAVNRYRPGQP